MHRVSRPDPTLDRLNDERDHLAIQLSLADDAEDPDLARAEALRSRLKLLEQQIAKYRPADA